MLCNPSSDHLVASRTPEQGKSGGQPQIVVPAEDHFVEVLFINSHRRVNDRNHSGLGASVTVTRWTSGSDAELYDVGLHSSKVTPPRRPKLLATINPALFACARAGCDMLVSAVRSSVRRGRSFTRLFVPSLEAVPWAYIEILLKRKYVCGLAGPFNQEQFKAVLDNNRSVVVWCPTACRYWNGGTVITYCSYDNYTRTPDLTLGAVIENMWIHRGIAIDGPNEQRPRSIAGTERWRHLCTLLDRAMPAAFPDLIVRVNREFSCIEGQAQDGDETRETFIISAGAEPERTARERRLNAVAETRTTTRPGLTAQVVWTARSPHKASRAILLVSNSPFNMESIRYAWQQGHIARPMLHELPEQS